MRLFTTTTVAAAVALAAGFVVGRQTADHKESVRYIKGNVIRDTVEVGKPYKVEVPSEPMYIYAYRTDTVTMVRLEKVDTAAILADWSSKRYYRQTLFEGEQGQMSIDAEVQYNRLAVLNYTYEPREKLILAERKKTWQPFAEVSYSTLDYVSVGGGMFYNDLGVSLKYGTNLNRKGVEVSLIYKF